MTKEQFAMETGFESYNTLLIASALIIFDHGINYYVTQASNGWMAWIDGNPIKLIGWFADFKQAQTFLIVAFKAVEGLPEPYPMVSETHYLGDDY
ncbi:MAG: hypothetical protein WA125_04065 [Desulfosporosinus sp.]